MTFAARRILSVTSVLSITAFARTAAAADTVVQVDVSSVIDGRTVSTVANNVITPWTATDGVDGDGNADGFVTTAVEAILNTQGKTEGGKIGLALPDDGMFPATTRLPAIQLHFSNAAPITSTQTHQLHINMGPQNFMFSVPTATYRKMFLLITTSEGSANLTVTLNYAGGTAAQVITAKLPDYGIGGAAANDPVFFNLIQGMHKWSGTDQEGDTPSHTITGIEINPTATGMLTSIQVAKTSGHVVFWGATGIATSAVTTGAGGSSGTTDGGAGGATGTDGGAGAGATAGAGGTAGASGTAGTSGTAGASGTAGGAGTAGTTGGTAGTTGGTAGATGNPGTAGSVSGTAGAGTTGTGGAGGTTTGGRSSGGGCTLAGTPARGGAAASALLIALAFALRKRRRA